MFFRLCASLPLLLAAQSIIASPAGIEQTINSSLESRLVSVCEAPVAFMDTLQQADLGPQTRTDLQHAAVKNAELGLVKRVNDYELVYNKRSLDNSTGFVKAASADPVHLVLERGNGPEHLVFLLDAEGYGELLWSSHAANEISHCQPGHF